MHLRVLLYKEVIVVGEVGAPQFYKRGWQTSFIIVKKCQFFFLFIRYIFQKGFGVLVQVVFQSCGVLVHAPFLNNMLYHKILYLTAAAAVVNGTVKVRNIGKKHQAVAVMQHYLCQVLAMFYFGLYILACSNRKLQ